MVTDVLPSELADADVVVSMEVGQQLPESSANRYVDVLCRIAPIVVFSSGTPEQGDRRPINEQPHHYWITKFSQRGYRFDEPLSLGWREEWKEKKTAPWFYWNVMIFRNTNLFATLYGRIRNGSVSMRAKMMRSIGSGYRRPPEGSQQSSTTCTV